MPPTTLTLRKWIVPLWLALGLAAVLIVWLAPAEQTLGQNIKWVYIHIAFIWTAMLEMLAVGGLSLGEAFSARTGWRLWREAMSWGTLTVLALAVITSLIVTQVNWGSIFWDEPRIRTLLQAMAVWVILHFGGFWINYRRWRGLLTAGAVAVALIPMRLVPLILHPQNPIDSFSSPLIRLAILALFVICLIASVSGVWVLKQRLKV